jgi:hypothetical protein
MTDNYKISNEVRRRSGVWCGVCNELYNEVTAAAQKQVSYKVYDELWEGMYREGMMQLHEVSYAIRKKLREF